MLVNLLYCPGEILLDVEPQDFEAGLTSAHISVPFMWRGWWVTASLLKPMMSSLVSMVLSSRLNLACERDLFQPAEEVEREEGTF